MKLAAQLFLVVCLSACAAANKDLATDARLISRNSVVGAFEGLDEVDAAKLRALRDKLVGDVDVRRLAEDVARAATIGAGKGLQEGEYAQRIAAIVDAELNVVRQEGGATVAQVIDKASPALRAALVEATRDFVRQMSSSLRTDVTPAMAQLVRTLADVTTAAVAKSLSEFSRQMPMAVEQLTPALRALTASVVAGGIQSFHDNLHAEDAQGYAFAIGNGFAQGMRQGLLDERTASRLEAILTAVAVGLGLALAASIVVGVLLLRRWQLARASLATIAERIEHSPSLDETVRASLKRDVRASADAGGVGPWLHGFLKDRGI